MTRNTGRQHNSGELPELIIRLIIQNMRKGNEDWKTEKQTREEFYHKRAIVLRKAWFSANPNAYDLEKDDTLDYMEKLDKLFFDETYDTCPILFKKPPSGYVSRFGYVYSKAWLKIKEANPGITYEDLKEQALGEAFKLVDRTTDQYIGEQYV